MKKPIVSIIIPTFNEERNIARLLISIKKQTSRFNEIIVVDDGSTDKTVEIANKYTNKVYKRKHAERSAQRNFGVSHAHSKFVFFLDADMELTNKVVKNCLENIKDNGALVVPEKTVGKGFVAEIRKFERKMYLGDPTIEVARFFPLKVFRQFRGYDLSMTGTEDYDLPKRISTKYNIGRAKEFILHHEEGLTLAKQLRKKFYYAKKSSSYVNKHPDLISKQGILIFRKAYLVHWREFVKNPKLGISLIFMRLLETISAAAGFALAVGPLGFIRSIILMIKNA